MQPRCEGSNRLEAASSIDAAAARPRLLTLVLATPVLATPVFATPGFRDPGTMVGKGLPSPVKTLIATSFSLLLAAVAAPAPAQSGTGTAVHHTRHHVVARRPVCPAAQPAPAVPAGLPAAVGPVQTAFSLRYVDAVVGTGAPAQPGDYLTVHYTGWLASDGTKFDSSLDRGQPFTFQQGTRQVILGWDQGFAGMKVGGKRRLFIPYQLAYGDQGRPPVIPPKSDLIFDIQLVAASATPPGETPAPPTPAQPPATPQR